MTIEELNALKGRGVGVVYQSKTPQKTEEKEKKRAKFGNKRGISNGSIEFQSDLEKKRYEFLSLMVKAGKIKAFEYECEKFMLQEFFKYRGKGMHLITYTPDFKVTLNNGLIVWEDTKSEPTRKSASYKIKMKLFIKMYLLGNDSVLDFKEILNHDEYYFDE